MVDYHTKKKKPISSEKDRQYNGHKKGQTDLHNTTQKTKDWTPRIPLKTGDELVCSGKISVTLVTNQWCVINEERTGLWLRQTEPIFGNVWHIYSVTDNLDMV